MTRASHRAYTPGKPSVTQILKHLGWSKDALIGWAHKLGKEGRSLRERDEAAELGSCCHAMAGAAFGGPPLIPSEWRAEDMSAATPNAARVIAAIHARGWTVVASETAMESESFAGTLDLVVRDADGIHRIVDLKTGKGIYSETGVQLGAYAWLWRMRMASTPEVYATEGSIIHAPFGGADLRIVDVSAAQMHAGELIFRRLLDIHEASGLLREIK